jgi:hypothetical protein
VAEWTPFQTHYFSEKLVAPGIESGTSGSVARNSDHYITEAVFTLFIITFMQTAQLTKHYVMKTCGRLKVQLHHS